MKIEEILFKQFPNMPTLGEVVKYLRKEHSKFEGIEEFADAIKSWYIIRNYQVRTEEQQIQLKYLVPCNKEGEVLEEPDFLSGDYDDNGHGDTDKFQYKIDVKEYQNALKDVLFEGMEVGYKSTVNNYLVIEGKESLFSIRIYEDINKYKLPISDLVGEKVTINFWEKIVK